MESRRRPEYNLDIFADLACVKDVVKGASESPFSRKIG
jgi:autophagy-related protein 101